MGLISESCTGLQVIILKLDDRKKENIVVVGITATITISSVIRQKYKIW